MPTRLLALMLFLPAVTGFKPALRVSGVNIDITPAMQEIAEKKMAAPLAKFASVINDAKGAELHMKVESQFVHDKKKTHARQTHIAEVTAHLKGSHRTVVVRSESEDNIYMAVDSLEALLSRKLRKAKDQWADKGRKKRGQKIMSFDAEDAAMEAGSFDAEDAD
jgi:ribosomal subunit interface protein